MSLHPDFLSPSKIYQATHAAMGDRLGKKYDCLHRADLGHVDEGIFSISIMRYGHMLSFSLLPFTSFMCILHTQTRQQMTVNQGDAEGQAFQPG